MNCKFLKKALVFAVVFFIGICFGRNSMEIKASNLTQTDAQKKSMTISWQADSEAISYNVYQKESNGKKDYVLAGNTQDTSYTLTGLKPATRYEIRVTSVKEDLTESAGFVLYNAVTIPDRLTGLKQVKWYYWIEKLNVKWNQQTGANGYEVRLYSAKNKLLKKQNLNYSSASFQVKNNNVYKVKVRSYVTFNKVKKYSSWSTIYCLNQPMLSTAEIKGGKLELKWGKISGATEYRVYVSQKARSGYKKVATVKKSKKACAVKKFKGKKFSSRKTYYVYVEAVCNKGGTKNTSGVEYCWNTRVGGGLYNTSRVD